MMKQIKNNDRAGKDERPSHHVRLPGFITGEEEIGLGDVMKRATSYLGIRGCEGCEQRRRTLNRWMAFNGRQR